MKLQKIIFLPLLLSFSLSGCFSGTPSNEGGGGTITPPTPNPQSEHDGSVNSPYTVKEACDIAKSLTKDAQTEIKYFIKGYISGTPDTSGVSQFGNVTFYIADQEGSDKFYCFQVCYLDGKKFTGSENLKENDEIIMFSYIVNYKGTTPETTNKGTAYIYQHNNKKSSTVPEQGLSQGDANAKAVTISQMKSENSSYKTEGANNKNLYRLTGTAQWAVNTTYGNFDLVDSTGYIYVYGSTANKKGLVSSSNGYTIDNDRSFSSLGIKAGDEVTIEGWYAWHAYSSSYGISQFTGYITNVTHQSASNINAKSYDTSLETYSGNYYSSVENKSGNELLLGLHNLMDDTHTNFISYDSLYSGYSDIGENKCFYANTSLSKGNREHVWPQSLSGASSSNTLYGEQYGGSDFHHVRHANKDNNSKRGNSMFGPVYGPAQYSTIAYSGGGNNKYTTNVFEPADEIKGDVARIIMYMYMHYNNAANMSSISGWKDRSYYGTMDVRRVMGPNSVSDCFKLLRLWNAEDPVSQMEKERNEEGYQRQGNRNPFIDHPSYADEIWG